MASIHADDAEEELNVQCDDAHDKMSKTHLMLGVLGVVAVVVVTYAVIKKIKNK